MAGQQICKELLFEVSGNAVDIARAHEIDLHSAFNSVDFRGEDGEGKLRGSDSEGNKVDKGGEGDRKIVLEGGRGLKVVVAREKKTKGEGGAVARAGSKGEGRSLLRRPGIMQEGREGSTFAACAPVC